jgi:hypothetical protein
MAAKRKCSTPVNPSKMEIAMNYLVSLEEELNGIQETEMEMDAVMKHVHALQEILKNAKKPVCKVLSLSYTISSPQHSDWHFHP